MLGCFCFKVEQFSIEVYKNHPAFTWWLRLDILVILNQLQGGTESIAPSLHLEDPIPIKLMDGWAERVGVYGCVISTCR